MKITTKLRQLMAEGKTIVKPGAYDALSAKIMQQCGFKAIGLSGYSVSVAFLGKPDLGFISLTDVALICRNIVNTVDIPLIADADTGFGNAINVLYTVETLIKSGAAACHIEDQEFPKRCGHVGGKRLISTEEMSGKIKAAAKVRDELDKDFVIIARCDARGTPEGSLEKLVDRCNAYVQAGADMIFPEGIPTEEELRIVAEKVKAPLHYNRTGKMKGNAVSPLIPMKTLQEIGICIVSQAVGPLLAASRAMWEWGNDVVAHDTEALKRHEKSLEETPMGNFHQFTGMKEYIELEKIYLPQEEERIYEGSLGFSSNTR